MNYMAEKSGRSRCVVFETEAQPDRNSREVLYRLDIFCPVRYTSHAAPSGAAFHYPVRTAGVDYESEAGDHRQCGNRHCNAHHDRLGLGPATPRRQDPRALGGEWRPDRYADKIQALLQLPLVAIALTMLFAMLPRL